MESRPNDRKSVAMMVSSMLIFGTIGIFRKNIPLSSAFLAFSRGILGGLFIWIPSQLKRKKDGVSSRSSLRSLPGLAFTGALIGFNWILLFEAYRCTTVAVATLCYYMQPTIVMLLSPVIFRERLSVRSLLCAGAAVLGMVLVSGVFGGGVPGESGALGLLPGLGAAVLYAGVVILNKRLPETDVYRRTTVQLFSAGLVMIPYLLLTGGFSAEGFTPLSAVLLLVVGIVHTGVAYFLYFGSIKGLRVQSVALLSYIDPVSALLFSAVFLGEPLSLLHLLGAVLIIGSAVLGELGSAGSPPKKLPRGET